MGKLDHSVAAGASIDLVGFCFGAGQATGTCEFPRHMIGAVVRSKDGGIGFQRSGHGST